MKSSNRVMRTGRNTGRHDYRNTIRRRNIEREILIWIAEIAIVVMLAFLAAYFFWR